MDIVLKNYTKSYKQHTVLQFDELHFTEGIHWLKGINGSGKSTLLRSIAGIIPFEGSCKIGEIEMNEKTVQYRKQVSYSYADPQFPPYLSGKTLIEFVAETREASSQQVNDLVAYFNISDYYSTAISSYSSGMLKKIALIMAFVGSSNWILLDEPFTTIDLATANALYQLIGNYRAAGCSFLIASHQPLDENKLVLSSSYEVIDKTIRQLF